VQSELGPLGVRLDDSNTSLSVSDPVCAVLMSVVFLCTSCQINDICENAVEARFIIIILLLIVFISIIGDLQMDNHIRTFWFTFL